MTETPTTPPPVDEPPAPADYDPDHGGSADVDTAALLSTFAPYIEPDGGAS